jgi:TatA/E family protein of Tat protein translocase
MRARRPACSRSVELAVDTSNKLSFRDLSKFVRSMMKRMSFSETIFLFVLALVIFGPKKLPEIARQIGKALNEFRRASNEFKSQIEQEIAHLEVEKPTILPPTPAVPGTTSRTQSLEAESQSKPTDAPATLAGTEQNSTPAARDTATQPVATEAVPATEDISPPDAVTSNTSQESHA